MRYLSVGVNPYLSDFGDLLSRGTARAVPDGTPGVLIADSMKAFS
jgi:hypothetical protein